MPVDLFILFDQKFSFSSSIFCSISCLNLAHLRIINANLSHSWYQTVCGCGWRPNYLGVKGEGHTALVWEEIYVAVIVLLMLML